MKGLRENTESGPGEKEEFVEFQCPHCFTWISVSADLSGNVIICPDKSCQGFALVPHGSQLSKAPVYKTYSMIALAAGVSLLILSSIQFLMIFMGLGSDPPQPPDFLKPGIPFAFAGEDHSIRFKTDIPSIKGLWSVDRESFEGRPTVFMRYPDAPYGEYRTVNVKVEGESEKYVPGIENLQFKESEKSDMIEVGVVFRIPDGISEPQNAKIRFACQIVRLEASQGKNFTVKLDKIIDNVDYQANIILLDRSRKDVVHRYEKALADYGERIERNRRKKPGAYVILILGIMILVMRFILNKKARMS